jgi:hypothetical protein
VQERFEQSRGVRVRLGIARTEEDQGHPCQGHEPVF